MTDTSTSETTAVDPESVQATPDIEGTAPEAMSPGPGAEGVGGRRHGDTPGINPAAASWASYTDSASGYSPV